MSLLTVINRNNILVVDHRLVAAELGIKPKNILANIDKHLITPENEQAFERVAFETEPLETNGGIQDTRVAYLSQSQAEFLMTLSRNKPQVVAAKRNLVRAFTQAKQALKEAIPAQNHEMERMKLELELIRAKQHFQDTGYAIQLSTSLSMLRWLRGEAPPPEKLIYLERFVDASGREIGSAKGRSLTQLITDAGLNPKSKCDKDREKHALKRWGFDYERMENWSEASYLRKYPVLEDKVYDQALKAVLREVMDNESEQNLFVHQMQQEALSPQKQPRAFQGVEP